MNLPTIVKLLFVAICVVDKANASAKVKSISKGYFLLHANFHSVLGQKILFR